MKTSRHLLRGATKRGVFLGGDKNEDRVSDELTFLSPRPTENHDRSKLRRKTKTKTKKCDTIVVAFVFLLTYYLSFSWTTSGRVHNTSVSSERALELRAKYAKLVKAEKERALKRYGYHGGGHLLGGNHIGHHILEYSSPLPESSSSSSSYGIGAFERVTRKMLATYVTGQTDYVTPSATTCGSTGSYTVPGADTMGEFGGRMCCSAYYATAVTYCGATEDKPSFEYDMYVTAGENSQTSISSGATSTGSGDCKTYDTAANPAKICVLSVCKSTDTSDCAFKNHSVTFTHAPFPPPPPDSQILSSGTAKVWSVWVGSVVSLAVAVALTIVV